jgi:predicted porin
MKKSLIALAALAATSAFAQSSVQVVGTFDPSIVSQKNTYGNGNSVSQSFVRNNSQGTSQITFKGTEDLGQGLKVNFLLENDFDTRFDARGAGAGAAATTYSGGVSQGSTNFGSGGGEQFLNLEGGFGKLAVGAPNTPTLAAQAQNPFGTKIGGGFGLLNSGKVRNNNSLVYTSPSFAGITASYAYSFKTSADANPATGIPAVADVSDVGVTYVNGPLVAMVTSYKVATVGATLAKTDNNFTATYDLGIAKLGIGNFTQKQTGVVDKVGQQVFATIPLSGKWDLRASYGSVNDKTAADKNSKISAIGVKNSISKTTSIYARFVSQTNDNAALTAAKKTTSTLVGMQTNF